MPNLIWFFFIQFIQTEDTMTNISDNHCEMISSKFGQMFFHFQDGKFSCPKCTFKFETTLAFRRHLRSHRHSLKYFCEKCGDRFKSRITLRKHVKLHSNLKPYKCPKCNAEFKRHDQFYIHMKRKHP